MRRGDELLNGEAAHSVPCSKTQREAVLAETDRVLADPTFRKSHRCVALMRRMVELALDGGHIGVKERTLGIEVFGRDPDYDSNSDPIVRMTANEIRKRLAQYYQENSPRQGVRLHLVPGSYLPEFHFEQPELPAGAHPAESQEPNPGPDLLDRPVAHSAINAVKSRLLQLSLKWILWSASALLLLVAGYSVVAHYSLLRSPQYAFWKPFLQSKLAPMICVADDSALEWTGVADDSAKSMAIAAMIAKRELPTVISQPHSPRSVPFLDAREANVISRWLMERGRNTDLVPASSLTLQDLRVRPAVMIGIFDNPWTLALLTNLRFSPGIDPYTGMRWINDAQDPGKHGWTYTPSALKEADADYGIITRFLDPETGNWVVTIGGLGQYGTEAAAALLTYPDYASLLPAGVRSSTNFQIVVKSSIIKGNGGPPQVVAFYSW